MKLVIHGRNIELTPALENYTRLKMAKAIHHFEEMVREADIHLSVARNPSAPKQIAEVTVFANGIVIRAQEKSENLYASIDLVANKLSRQLRRFKDRNTDHHHSHGHKASQTPSMEEVLNENPVEESLIGDKKPKLPNPGIRRKYFSMPPMSIEQARQQLEFIGHHFYLFREKDSKELKVIYRRNHGGYGVIQERS
tara:strand:- start:2674 stop:3261 length:588 start_codon:yes stop_codon:yes gene_type:complete